MTVAPPAGASPAERIREIASALRVAGRRFGTPVVVTDAVMLTDAAASLAAAFPDPWRRRFSVKANDVAPIVAELGQLGLGANVVSRGEWSIARRAGIANAEITLEGIGKTAADLADAVRAAREGDPLAWVSIESSEEAEALGSLATRAGLGRKGRTRLDVLLRLNPDVVPETSRGLAVGLGQAKFGMDETELTAVLERLPRSVRARGVHVHVGSQLAAVDAWRDAARRAIALVALLGAGRDDFDTVDLGGGFPVAAWPDGAVPPPDRFAREVDSILVGTPDDRRPRRLAIEPGRYLVANAGWLVARVLHVRDRAGRLIVLDTGMTELIRPALYGAVHEVLALTSLGRPVDDPERARLAGHEAAVHGPVCESTDALGEHRLPPLRRGDLVAIATAGAYATSMASTYNGRPRPPQILLDRGGALRLVRRRGSVRALG